MQLASCQQDLEVVTEVYASYSASVLAYSRLWNSLLFFGWKRKSNKDISRRFIDSDNDREEETVNENVKVNNDTDANQNKAKINMKHLFLMY